MTMMDEYLNIDTPENVAFGYDIAGLGSRFLATIIDTLVIIVLQLIVNLTMLSIVSTFSRDWLGESFSAWVIAIFGLISFGFFWGYYIVFEMVWNGQSPGKRQVGLRVIRADGTPITLPESIIRNLVRLIDFLPMYYGVGIVVMFVHPQSRRLGDLAAGTLVVRDREAVTLDSLALTSGAPSSLENVPDSVRHLPVERLTPQRIQMAEEFLRRRNNIAVSNGLDRQILEALYREMDHPLPELSSWDIPREIKLILTAYKARG